MDVYGIEPANGIFKKFFSLRSFSFICLPCFNRLSVNIHKWHNILSKILKEDTVYFHQETPSLDLSIFCLQIHKAPKKFCLPPSRLPLNTLWQVKRAYATTYFCSGDYIACTKNSSTTSQATSADNTFYILQHKLLSSNVYVPMVSPT